MMNIGCGAGAQHRGADTAPGVRATGSPDLAAAPHLQEALRDLFEVRGGSEDDEQERRG